MNKTWLAVILLLSACGNSAQRGVNMPPIQSSYQMLNMAPGAMQPTVNPTPSSKPAPAASPSQKALPAPAPSSKPSSPIQTDAKPEETPSTSSRSGKTKPLTIFMYPSYGHEEEVYIRGRVFKTEGSDPVTPSASKLKSLLNNLDMLTVSEMKKFPVEIQFQGKTLLAKTDGEGLFSVKIHPDKPVAPGYHQATVVLPASETRYSAQQSESVVVINPKQDTHFGVVSDIDDTIQKSDVTSKLQALKNLLFKNYTTQVKFPGTPELYQALDLRSDGVIDGDVHYLSGSPHQMINRIMHFMEHNQFPKGSLDLKQMGFGSNDDSPMDQLKYKLGKLRHLFNTYPQRKFVCFGDSGEKDPEIYRQIAQEYPNRVLGIYINNVSNELSNAPRFKDTLVTRDASEAAADLLNKHLLKPEDVEKIRQAVAATP